MVRPPGLQRLPEFAGFHRTLFQYNNSMYVTAGYAMERATGVTWEEFVRRRIFEPLKMTESDTSAITGQSVRLTHALLAIEVSRMEP